MEPSYISFLHYCLNDTSSERNWDGMDWQGLHDFAVKQAIGGVVFQGVERLGKDVGIPEELLFNWFAESELIRQRNRVVNEVAAKLVQWFARNGFRSCLLKGQGNAMMYPDPLSRASGDIDVWLEGNRKEILNYVRSIFPNAPFQYHHVDLPPLKGVSIEVHFIPSFFSNPLQNKRMQTFFREQADAQFSHLVQLSGCDGSVAVPTDEFNLVYQMTHIMRHLFDEGIGIRQLMDYYFLLKKGVAEDVRMRTVETLHRLGMERFTKAVMYVLQHLFGIEDRFLLAEPDKRLGEVILEEVYHTGNLGQYEDRFSSNPETGFGFVTTVMHRLPRLIRYFPVETLSRPLFLAWYPFWKMRYR